MKPGLSEQRLTELLLILLKRLEEVEQVEMVGPQEIHFKAKSSARERRHSLSEIPSMKRLV